MPLYQQFITIGIAVLATILTRFLPYVLFPEGRKVPDTIQYLGKVLPPAVFGLLVVYCFRNVSLFGPLHAIPELIATAVVLVLYLWRRDMLIPMAGGTVVYMLIMHLVG